MKNSPLQIGTIRYSDVVIRAIPNIGDERVATPLPITVDASVLYDSDGEHVASITVHQRDETFPYTITVTSFAAFSIDVEGCTNAYKSQFNPAVVAVNVARILYSSTREMISIVTARAPYDTANIPALLIEPKDVQFGLEQGKETQILSTYFGMPDDAIAELQRMATDDTTPKPEQDRTGQHH